MRLFYLILFGAFGLFNVLAAVFGWDWYIGYWSRGRRKQSRGLVRVLIGAAGGLLILYGLAFYFDVL
ncbi:MAG: hypothetical protein ACI4JF_09745 [Oscillospiraceae bacterium]